MSRTRPQRTLVTAFALIVMLVILPAGGWPKDYIVPDNAARTPAPVQSLPFSHQAHVSAGLDCLFCHTGQKESMTFPETGTCMTCHATLAADRPAIRRLREFHEAGEPVPWVRVYMVGEGVTWGHEQHIAAGVQCENCHGEVGSMRVMSEVKATRAMATCIACHEARGAPTACTTCHAWPTDELLEIE